MKAPKMSTTSISYSDNPEGFPQWFRWAPTITYGGGTTNPTSNTILTARWSVSRGNLIELHSLSEIIRGTGNRSNVRYSCPIFYEPTDQYQVGYGYEGVTTGGNPPPVATYLETISSLPQVVILLPGAMTSNGGNAWKINYRF